MLGSRHKMYAAMLVLGGLLIGLYQYRYKIFEAWMRFDIRNEYIVVSMTTTPHRINEIQRALDFALTANIPLKALYLNVPYIFKRDNLEYVIPGWLKEKAGVTILRPKDYGPATKLLGTLEKANLPSNAIVITLDDDIIYPKNVLLYLAYTAKQNPDHAVGLSGMNPFYNKNGEVIVDSPNGIGLKNVRVDKALVSILEGFAGIAYRPHFFDQSIFEIENAPHECINSDDLYISFHLAKNHVPRQVLRTRTMFLEQVASHALGFKEDGLTQIYPSLAKRHRACVAFMKQTDPNVVF